MKPISVPTVEDFTARGIPPEQDLDGFSAWKNFGGLSVDEAYAKFCEVPEAFQEDFMWMGHRAFAFYFPVLDRYMREQESKSEFDGVTCILASCIAAHLPAEDPEVRSLIDRLLGLCDFVLESLQAIPEADERQRSVHEVASAWSDLRAKLV